MTDGNRPRGARPVHRDPAWRMRTAGELGLVACLLGVAVLAALLTAGRPVWALIAGG